MQILERRPNENGRDYAMRVLKDNIINLELEPGMAINDRDLAAQMGLSRTPVREAMLDLAKVKIVEIYPQRGSVVARIDYSLAEEAQFVRYVLEIAVIELVCNCIDEDGIRLLEENVALQEFYQTHPQPQRTLELDDEFHRLLFQIAGKNQAYEVTRSLTIHFDRLRRMAVEAVKEQKWMEDHREILGAVKHRDVARAKRCMDRHLNRYHVDEAAIREQYPQYFTDEKKE